MNISTVLVYYHIKLSEIFIHYVSVGWVDMCLYICVCVWYFLCCFVLFHFFVVISKIGNIILKYKACVMCYKSGGGGDDEGGGKNGCATAAI